MALINCRECGAQVSDAAATCPHCGIEYPSNAKLVGSSIEQVIHSLVKIIGVLVIVCGLVAVLSGYLGWIVGLPLIFIGTLMFVAPGFSASLLIVWLIWANMQDDGKGKVSNSGVSNQHDSGKKVNGKAEAGNPIPILEELIVQKRPTCKTPIEDIKLSNGLIDRYRVFVDVDAQTVIFMNMAASDTLLEIYDLKNKKYGQLHSYKTSLLIHSLLTPKFFDTQVSSILDEKSCNLVNGSLHQENFFSCTLQKNVWYAEPAGNSGYECKWLYK